MRTSGMSPQEIAFDLGISIKTVECHWHNLGGKLGTGDPVKLTRMAIAEGLVSAGRRGEKDWE